MLFGWFVGAWDFDVTNIAVDGTKHEFKGEWHFGWALEGRAIMDPWITPRRSLRGQVDPYELIAEAGFDNLVPGHPIYDLMTGDQNFPFQEDSHGPEH